ncbi:hypothetical protein ASF40_20505 [Microbacterium sp. Leaf288]|uniref:ABC transporter permease n=1 Tax=Microbacterium sp. Leaf288 TaxID=1736323 RepID=UPI0006F5280C|nr:ABC transporter permease [Microbacterium sp. Leaf288]KQP73225.1 hypothetical protein ASF40_20505 [Microbacterium sp. Leaf288]
MSEIAESTNVVTEPLGAQLNPDRKRTISALIAAPVIFIFVFISCYVSALHAPTPHELPVGMVASSSVQSDVEDGMQDRAGDDAFVFTSYRNADQAREAIKDREIFAAFVIDDQKVTSLVANAAGVSGTSIIKTVGAEIASSMQLESSAEDVVPTREGDGSGTGLFFLFVVTTVGSYLAITMLFQAHPRARLRTQLITAVSAAILAPVLCFALSTIFIGDYGADFGTMSSVLGVSTLYGLTVALLAIVLVRILGPVASLACNIFLTAFNLPSAGGALAAGFLPPFWQGVHGFWIGAGAFEPMRSILYFDGAQAAEWLDQLLVWTTAAVLGVVIVGIVDAVRRRKRTHEGTPATEVASMALAGSDGEETHGSQPENDEKTEEADAYALQS